MAAALQASVEQRRPRVLLTGGGLSLLASALALGLFRLIGRARMLLIARLEHVIDNDDASSKLRWARHGWLLVHRVTQLLMGFLWLTVAYLWLTFVLARFPLTEPLGDRLTDFLFGLLDTFGSGVIHALPALATAVVILFLTKTVTDVIGNFFKAAKEGRVQVQMCIRDR